MGEDKEPDQARVAGEGDVEEVESGEKADKRSMSEEVERAADREDEALEG